MKNDDIYSIHSTSFLEKKKGIGKGLCLNELHVEKLITHIELMVFHN